MTKIYKDVRQNTSCQQRLAKSGGDVETESLLVLFTLAPADSLLLRSPAFGKPQTVSSKPKRHPENMPIGEIEIHPYLQKGQINGATKLILGSFPVYECTDQDNPLKQQNRQNEGTIRFFYGSIDSGLWGLYRDNIDDTIILPPNPNLILQSLAQRQIAVSDTIASCERHGFSSEDSKLIRRTYNRQGIQTLIQNGVRKIICTSKGVLKDLEKQIILQGNLPFGQVDNLAGGTFQDNFITGLGGNNNQITSPIAKVFIVDNFQVTALAIPSPGSPQRQLAQFGFNGEDWRNYADNYFSNAFNWLKE